MKNAMLCAKCEKRFNAPWSLKLNRFAISDRCHDCLPADELKFNNWTWDPVMPMPIEFRNTDQARLPQNLQALITKKLFVDGRGLLIHGQSGLGKTRTAWIVLEKWWKEHDCPSIKTYTMRRLQNELEESHERGKHMRTLNEVIECPMLFLDDLGKEKLTPRLASDLFSIVDERSVNHRPCLITTNFNGALLSGWFPETEMGIAFVRRLKDYYDLVGSA